MCCTSPKLRSASSYGHFTGAKQILVPRSYITFFLAFGPVRGRFLGSGVLSPVSLAFCPVQGRFLSSGVLSPVVSRCLPGLWSRGRPIFCSWSVVSRCLPLSPWPLVPSAAVFIFRVLFPLVPSICLFGVTRRYNSFFRVSFQVPYYRPFLSFLLISLLKFPQRFLLKFLFKVPFFHFGSSFLRYLLKYLLKYPFS